MIQRIIKYKIRKYTNLLNKNEKQTMDDNNTVRSTHRQL